MANRAAHLFARAGDCADKTALIFEDERIDFGTLARHVQEVAGGLAHLGIRKGTHVGILIPSCPDFIIVQQALFALGAVVTPLNILYRPSEIADAVMSCDLAWLVSTQALLEPLDIAQPLPGLSFIGIDMQGSDGPVHSLPAALTASQPLQKLADVAPNDLAMLLLTSATTGKAKGVMLSCANLAANYDRTPQWLGLDGDAVILCALPLYNTFGLNQGINAMLVTGATMVLHPRFDAGHCIEAIAAHGCTFLPAVPTMLQKIVDHPAVATARMETLTRIMTGGAPVPPALLQRLLAAAPQAEVLTGYGLTEGTALVTLTRIRPDGNGAPSNGHTIGRVLDGMTLGIMDEQGRLMPAGGIGEIVIRGPNMMAGYYRAPQESALALAGGWLHSGDIGYLDEDGHAYIVDRKKDVIIRGGQNIYPADIEEVLYHIPGVAEVAVVGMPDDLMGEVPVAFVALRPGCTLSGGAMLERCRTELAPFKLPFAIHVRDELPKGPTGKILRRALRPGKIAR
ncbi:AMP-binding protein [Sphingobium sp.]|uniref:class I adenylate-forming enzyme family protein n=1 Tax=Sphingobium sp. TaxID=1912891 RepID=UPI0028BDEF5A|nr:AMP-binding protein [Sphingobium sp.]